MGFGKLPNITGVEGVPGFSLREDVKINYIFEPDHLKLEWPVCLQ